MVVCMSGSRIVDDCRFSGVQLFLSFVSRHSGTWNTYIHTRRTHHAHTHTRTHAHTHNAHTHTRTHRQAHLEWMERRERKGSITKMLISPQPPSLIAQDVQMRTQAWRPGSAARGSTQTSQALSRLAMAQIGSRKMSHHPDTESKCNCSRR